MTTTRSGRSRAALLIVLSATAALAGGGRLLIPRWEPQVPAYRRKGPPEAKVVIAEFSDFQCPACAVAAPHLKSILDLHAGKVAVVYKHRAWDFHPHARQAALAAECAGKGGKFWDYHDRLFTSQPQWSVLTTTAASREVFFGLAKELGLEAAPFAACLADPATDALVAADLKEAEEKWVNSTPTFLIGGRRFVGANQLRTLGLNQIENMFKKS